ncbi:hypothetical protein [Paenibacillus sp. MBLB4367]|uniref:hypothetical protein n=1 Tax=Paenibacillus sp. MBLB4367 TaxID=3384767 RepID=UPI003907F82E
MKRYAREQKGRFRRTKGHLKRAELAARLYRRNKGDFVKAADCYRRIRSRVFALHPQVTFERDLTLAGIGPETLEEREDWLAQTSALQDECGEDDLFEFGAFREYQED